MFIETTLTEACYYWEPPVVDGYGVETFQPPILIKQARFDNIVRWEIRQVYVGTPMVGKWVFAQAVEVGGFICPAEQMTAGEDSIQPKQLVQARRIIDCRKATNFLKTMTLWEATV